MPSPAHKTNETPTAQKTSFTPAPHPKDDYESNLFNLDHQKKGQAPENDKGTINIGRILIAEDSSFDFRYLVSCLKSTGLQSPITWVEDGEELLHFLEGTDTYDERTLEDISLIILDLKMPKLDGLSALKKIRGHSNKVINKMPVVVLTTSIFEDDLRQASELGLLDYIVKPETQKETALMIEDMTSILRKLEG